MATTIFHPANRTTVKWANGTSTEIFIHPPGASLAARDFVFRISTATVEAERSDFTFFEGITRHLMILEGQLQLIHEGRYSVHLARFDQDTFSGEWKTRSEGKVRDFNLMLKGGSRGSLSHLRLAANARHTLRKDGDFSFVYVADGVAVIDGKKVQSGDLARLDDAAEAIADVECDLIAVDVWPR